MFGRIPPDIARINHLKKLIDLHRNHKFRGGLLGIKQLPLIALKITTVTKYTNSGNFITTGSILTYHCLSDNSFIVNV